MTDIVPSVSREDYDVLRSIKEIVLHPKQFFATMPVNGSFRQPLIFALSISVAVGLLVCITQSKPFIGIPAFIILYIISMFIGAGLLWLIAKLAGGTGSYKATFRASAYCNVVSLVAWIPYVGFWATFYELWLLILGVQRAQNLSFKAACCVVLIPFFILFTTGIVLGLLMMPHLH